MALANQRCCEFWQAFRADARPGKGGGTHYPAAILRMVSISMRPVTRTLLYAQFILGFLRIDAVMGEIAEFAKIGVDTVLAP